MVSLRCNVTKNISSRPKGVVSSTLGTAEAASNIESATRGRPKNPALVIALSKEGHSCLTPLSAADHVFCNREEP